MWLSSFDLYMLIQEEERLVIDPKPDSISPASIDLKLGTRILIPKPGEIDIKDPHIEYENIDMDDNGYLLEPGGFVLGSTLETVSMPNGYLGFIETRGNFARAGLQIHNSDGHIDPGYRGVITLELKNNSTQNDIRLYPGIKIATLYVGKTQTPSAVPYDGKYQGSKGPTPFMI